MIELRDGASMREYQDYIHQLDALHGWLSATPVRKCFLMGEEVGELFKAVRNLDGLDRDDPRHPAAIENAGEEIVDVFNYLLAIANRFEIDLEDAFRQKNRRNQRRSWA
jgi:NTP pyrophosphatase (non-canonical NTP hydrolase)